MRRRLEDPTARKTEGRTGCLITGAVLGVIFGATFAFYGLPPILRHYYGEKHVTAGQAYSGDAKTIAVTSVRPADPSKAALAGGDIVHVILSVRSNKTWSPQPADFSLELTSGGAWLQALPEVPTVLETSFLMPLGEERTLLLRYRLPEGEGVPEFLHIASPRVRLALPPISFE
ncbi:hypothetical protein AYO38_05015 [bacterium SCGC AG-212-C10]|nr:hypothetical protein AYO38_05015 [bacterium SCGC AG-212-C10]